MNRYTQLTPSQFNPLSLQEMMMVPLAKQKQYDNNLQSIEENNIFNVDKLDLHNNIVQPKIDEFQKQFNDVRDSMTSTGDIKTATKKLMKLRTERNNFLSADGIGGKAQLVKKAYMDNIAEIEKANHITTEDKEIFKQKAFERYKSLQNANTDNIAEYSHYSGLTSRRPEEEALKRAMQIVVDNDTRYEGNSLINRQELSAQKIYDEVTKAMFQDKALINYLNETRQGSAKEIISIAAMNAATSREVNQYHNRGSIDDGSGPKPKKVVEEKTGSGVISNTGAVITAKRRFKSIDTLRELAKDVKNTQNLYAKRTLEQMTSEIFKRNKDLFDKFREQMKGLPDELANAGNIIELSKAAQAGAVNFSKLEQINNKNYITAIGDNGEIAVFEVTNKAVEDYKKGLFKKPYEHLNNASNLGYYAGKAVVEKKTNISAIKEVSTKVDDMFNKLGAPSTKYSFDRLSTSNRNQMNESVLEAVRVAGKDNLQILQSYSTLGGKEVGFEDDKVKNSTLFDILKSGNVSEFKLDYMYIDEYSGLPAVRVSFVKKNTENRANDVYHELDLSINTTSGKTGVKSGEFSLLNALKDYGGKQGEVIYNYMKQSIDYKDIVENFDMYDFDNSQRIAQVLPNSLRKEGNSYNIWDNNGNFHLIIKSKDSSTPKPVEWKDLVSSEELKNMTYKSNPDFYKAMMKQGVDTNFISSDLSDILSYDEEGYPYIDEEKADPIFDEIINQGMPIQARDKVTLLNIIRSKK